MKSVHLTDAEAVADAPQNITLRAMRGCAIVWFLPYRRAEGVIEIPDSAKEQSVEAIIIDDATGYGLATGTRVLVSRTKGEGTYFECAGETLCRIKCDGLYLVDETEAA